MDEYFDTTKQYNLTMIVGALLVIAIVALFTVFGGGSKSSVETQLDAENGVFGIGGNGKLVIIELADIRSVELTDKVSVGELLDGPESDDVYAGTYQNDEFGTYSLFACKNATEYAVIYHNDQVAVFGSKNEKSVEKVYDELCAAVAALKTE